MAFNALIAQGIQPIGADVPQIANMLNQRRQQQFQNSLATNQDARAQGEYSANMAAAADQRQRARSQQDAQQAYTEAQYIKQAKDEELPGLLARLPHIAQAAKAAGVTDANGLRQFAAQAEAQAGAMLGKGPEQPKYMANGAHGTLKINPDGSSSVIGADAAGTMPGANGPSNVQEWNFYSKLPPDQQRAYLEMKRAQQSFVPEVNGVRTLVRPGLAGAAPTVQPLTNLGSEAAAQGAIAGAKSAGEVVGKSGAEAKIDLNSNLDDIQKMRQNVQGLLDAPGFSTIYGLSGKVDPRNYVAGTDAANAKARREQLSSQAFGISIQKMRGLGQLSNAEGLKVTQAYTRAIDPQQSPAAAKEAWAEVKGYLDKAELRAKQKAGVAGQQSAPASGVIDFGRLR